MNCKTARGLFSLHLDEGLSYEEQRALTDISTPAPVAPRSSGSWSRPSVMVRDLPEIPPGRCSSRTCFGRPGRSRGARRSHRSELRRAVAGFRIGTGMASLPALCPGCACPGPRGRGDGERPDLAPESHGRSRAAAVPRSASPKTTEPAVARASAAAPIVGPASIPVASGPFEELIAQMKDRLEADSPGVAEDTTGSAESPVGSHAGRGGHRPTGRRGSIVADERQPTGRTCLRRILGAWRFSSAPPLVSSGSRACCPRAQPLPVLWVIPSTASCARPARGSSASR